MISSTLRALLLTAFLTTSVFAIAGTGGTPLGGMGTGYVIFNGEKFSVSGKMPPAAADHCKGTPEKQISASGFHLFAGGTAKSPAKATSEDAKCPLQTADFGKVGDIKFTLNAFGPYWPGEGKEKFQLATSPLAFFDITAENSSAAAVEAAVAMEFANGGLLGGGNSGTVDGTKAISFAGSPDNAYLAADCDGTTPAFSAGAAGTFSTNGTLSNAAGNLVAAKCSVPAGGKVHFKFVLAWYRNYDSEGYYYQNFYTNSKEAATFGLSKFDSVRDGVTALVNRTMASNFPEWYKDRLLNNTYPLIHNSVVAKDGRSAFWEGNYGIIGTIDQGQHAAVFYTFNWPSVQWHELQYWARQQKSTGQIHHDFNEGRMSFTANSTENNRLLKAWDKKDHADYWWFPNTDTWSDLNCMYIFKAYELMLATGDLDSLKKSWDSIKKAASRLLDQAGTSKLFESSHSTYDQKLPGSDQFGYTPRYCASVALPAFSSMAEMAKVMGDEATATKYSEAYTATRSAFDKKYSSDALFGVETNEANGSRFNEGSVAGYSWANYLCLPPIMNETFITSVLTKMRNKQKTGLRANGEWVFYDVDHYGGSEIAINQPDAAMVIHQQDYDEYYKNAPNQVHWQSLQATSGNRGHDSYMTAPAVWHSYFQFCGYMIDNANKRLWIRPRIPTEMKGEIKNALLLNPKAMGTLNYKEDESVDATQTIKVAFDTPVSINELMLKNNTGVAAPFIMVNGAAVANVKAEGVAPEKNIRVTFAAPIQIGPDGITIEVHKAPVKNVVSFEQARYFVNDLQSAPIVRGKPVIFSVASAGAVTIEALALNGAKIGTLYSGSLSAGRHNFSWSGRTLNGKQISNSTIVLRLVTASGIVARRTAVIE